MYLVLASKSPRRQEILKKAGYAFIVRAADIDENLDIADPSQKVLELAKRKGLKVFSAFRDKDAVVLSADTVVEIDGMILGKPKDTEDAKKMLCHLQGRTHNVYTGVFIQTASENQLFFEKTEVTIRPMTEYEIDAYCMTPEPYDKAGGYAIQGVFNKYIDNINGDFFNVMGLPLYRVAEALKKYDLKKIE